MVGLGLGSHAGLVAPQNVDAGQFPVNNMVDAALNRVFSEGHLPTAIRLGPLTFRDLLRELAPDAMWDCTPSVCIRGVQVVWDRKADECAATVDFQVGGMPLIG